jgi:GNAT superfamily N-acetyltransferase
MKPMVPPYPEPALRVEQVQYPSFIEEIGRLRYEVWIKLVQAKSPYFQNEQWLDKNDRDSYHWVVQDQGKVIASARLSIHGHMEDLQCYSRIPQEALPWIELPVAVLNRLVVHPDYRGQKIAALLDEKRIQFARERAVRSLVGEPILSRIKVLEGFDFKVFGPVYFIPELPGVPVKFMAVHF